MRQGPQSCWPGAYQYRRCVLGMSPHSRLAYFWQAWHAGTAWGWQSVEAAQ